MIKIRDFENAITDIYSRGLMNGLAHLYIGEEAIATGVCANITSQDYAVSTHRGHGYLIAQGANLKKMMAEVLGRKDGYCKGKRGSMHIMDAEKGILGANGIVGAGIPVATGAAYSAKFRGTDQVKEEILAQFNQHPRIRVVRLEDGFLGNAKRPIGSRWNDQSISGNEIRRVIRRDKWNAYA